MAIPTDPYLGVQWHLINENTDLWDLNLTGAWNNIDPLDTTSPTYSGTGTRVAIVADGFDYNHSDLVPNYDRALDYDFEFGAGDAFGTAGDFEGTAMAGLIGAAANGVGTVGVAHGATLIGYRMRAASWSSPWDWLQDVSSALDRALNTAQADVTVLSRYIGEDSQHVLGFGADPELVADIRQSITNAVTLGRSGLGMSLVKAAGEHYFDWEDFDPSVDINMDPWTSDTRQIVVSGIGEGGGTYNGTNTGAPVLISAFGAMDQYFSTNLGGEIFTTDRTGSAGFGNRSYIANYGGTNAAASMVAGVVSLMYEANANLGWRDVQSILAASARHVGPEMSSEWSGWGWNGAETWNGGGLHFSNFYGYGLVDAWAAVRLAETWRLTGEAAGASANESGFALDVLNSTAILTTDEVPTEARFSRNSATNLVVERVTVTIAADIEDLRALSLYLISPTGVESELISLDGADQWNGMWTFETQAFRGERSAGTWTVRVTNDGYAAMSFTDAVIRVIGSNTLNDKYVFTDEYSDFGPSVGHESSISDDNGGTDTVNASAVSSGSIIRLDSAASRIDGVAVSFSDTIENAIGGDLSDNITGGTGANQLYGRRGADSINGGAGNDGVYGAWGNDILNGGSGVDTVTGGSDNDTIIDDDLLNGDRLLGEAGIDTIDYSRVSFGAGLVTINLTTGLATTTASSARDTISGFENVLGSQGGETIRGTAGINILSGNGGDDRLIGEAGNDVLTGGLGKDTLYGGSGADRFVFSSRSESPLGAACDVLTGYTSGPAFDGAGSAVGDIIDLAGIDANESSTGNQTFVFSTAQTIGTLRCLEVSGVTRVLGFVNSTAGADFQIDIQDGGVLASQYTAADFVL